MTEYIVVEVTQGRYGEIKGVKHVMSSTDEYQCLAEKERQNCWSSKLGDHNEFHSYYVIERDIDGK